MQDTLKILGVILDSKLKPHLHGRKILDTARIKVVRVPKKIVLISHLMSFLVPC